MGELGSFGRMTANATLEKPRVRPKHLTRARLKDRLRLRAFHAFYRHAFAEERDPLLRFAKAIIASAQPIRDREAFERWCARQRATDGL